MVTSKDRTTVSLESQPNNKLLQLNALQDVYSELRRLKHHIGSCRDTEPTTGAVVNASYKTVNIVFQTPIFICLLLKWFFPTLAEKSLEFDAYRYLGYRMESSRFKTSMCT